MRMELKIIAIALIEQLLIQVALADHTELESEDLKQDYCNSEIFQPRCLRNEVILMKSATYGRMHIGRCIKREEVSAFGNDSRYLGCSGDVLALLDGKCSGKVACDVRVAEISDENVKSCFPGLRFYLEVSYDCIGTVDESRSCFVDASTTPIHILGSETCGTKSHPWVVEAPVGQKVSINIITLQASESGEMTGKRKQQCYNSGLIVDKARKRNITICTTGSQRVENLYLSGGNTVDILLSTSGRQMDRKQFMIQLKAVGCSDIMPPDDAYLKRSDNTIVVGCYASRKSWHLYCEEGKWIGVVGNCSQGSTEEKLIAEFETNNEQLSNKQVMAIFALGGFTLAICLLVICIGAVCFRRIKSKNVTKQEYKTLNYDVLAARGQPEWQRGYLGTGTAIGLSGNDMPISFTQHVPTS